MKPQDLPTPKVVWTNMTQPITWQPTPQLRWVNREVKYPLDADVKDLQITHIAKVLQQRWTSDDGQVEWRDVPVEEEGK